MRDELFQDAASAIRTLCRNRDYTGMAAISLIVGLAAATAAFSTFSGLFLDALPYPDAERLVYLQERATSWPTPELGASYIDFDQWRTRNATFVDIAGFMEAGADLQGTGESTRVQVAYVTQNLLQTLGARPLMGRAFLPNEESGRDDGPPVKPRSGYPVALLSYHFWQQRFGGAADILGKTVRLDDRPYRVVGVLPPQAVYPAAADIWVPLGWSTENPGYVLEVVGRLRPGVTVAQAAADLERVHASIPAARSHDSKRTTPRVTPLREHYLADYRGVSELLLGVAGLLLLIACLNVAGLLMARGMARQRDVALRIALGAGRRRLVQQLLLESALLAAGSAAAGIILGRVALRGMLSLMPDVLPPWVSFHANAQFYWFAVGATLLTALLSGMAPALGALRTDVREILAESGTKATLSAARRRRLDLLVIGEVAVALIVLVTGGLEFEAFRNVVSRDPGFRAANVLTMAIDPSGGPSAQRFEICSQLLARLRSLPGVSVAGAIDYLPLGPGVLGRGDWVGWGIRPEGEATERGSAAIRTVTTGYFRAMGIGLVAGRDFDSHDEMEDRAQIVVNESFARTAWPGARDVIARRVRVQRPDWLTVVGVVRDVRHSGLEQPVRPEIYMAYVPDYWVPLTIVIRGSIAPQALAPLARQAVREVDSSVAVFDMRTMQERLDRSVWIRRAESWLFGVFAGVALLMAVAGIYGVLSYSVARRTREIGIRMALGAARGQVMGQVLREGMLLVGIGLALGLAGAWNASRLLGAVLAGVDPHEPRAYVAVIAVLVCAAVLANFVPARMAASVDPLQALRKE